MELFPTLTAFYETIEADERITTTHISLYMALVQQWNLHQGADSFTIIRSKVMKAAKISSRQTYNKCMHQLNAYGYIIYKPSYYKNGTRVMFRKLM